MKNTQLTRVTEALVTFHILTGGEPEAFKVSVWGCAAGWVNEQIGGVEYLQYIRELAKRVESDWGSIQADLKDLQQLVLAVEVRSPST